MVTEGVSDTPLVTNIEPHSPNSLLLIKLTFVSVFLCFVSLSVGFMFGKERSGLYISPLESWHHVLRYQAVPPESSQFSMDMRGACQLITGGECWGVVEKPM